MAACNRYELGKINYSNSHIYPMEMIFLTQGKQTKSKPIEVKVHTYDGL